MTVLEIIIMSMIFIIVIIIIIVVTIIIIYRKVGESGRRTKNKEVKK